MALLGAHSARVGRKVAGTVALSMLAWAAGCARNSSTPLSFEARPRTVLADFGISASRYPQLAVSPSGMLSMLALYQASGKTRLGFTMSHDGGDHFMPVVPVSERDAQISSHGGKQSDSRRRTDGHFG